MAQDRYNIATREYRRLLQQDPDGLVPASSLLAQARQAESEALAEYSAALRVYSDLMLHGNSSDEVRTDPARAIMQNKVTVVDDDESIRDSTRTLLRSAGYQVSTFASAEQFLDSGAVGETECLILDIRMPGIDGLELQQRLHSSGAAIPIIFLTAHDDAKNRQRAIEGGALDFLSKPFEANILVAVVETAMNRHSVSRLTA